MKILVAQNLPTGGFGLVYHVFVLFFFYFLPRKTDEEETEETSNFFYSVYKLPMLYIWTANMIWFVRKKENPYDPFLIWPNYDPLTWAKT